MKKITRIILWGAWYGSKNVGDQALLLSIADILGGDLNDVEFIVITDNPSHVYSYTKRDSIHRFKSLHARRQILHIVKEFMSADLFIFGGGVPFYDEWFHSIAIAFLTTLSKIFRVPCVLWAVSSQRVKSSFTRSVLRYLLSYASAITYRDEHTRQLFVECGMDDSFGKFVPDSAFTLTSSDKHDAVDLLERAGWGNEPSRPLIALTPRLLRSSDGEAHSHYSVKSTEQSQREIEVFAGVFDWLWENGYQPVFVPMNTVTPDDDREASRNVMMKAEWGRNALIIDEEIFPRVAANVYSYCQAAFVARVHGSVLAFKGRCPVLMYSFDLKHGGIMEKMGFPDQIFDPEQHSLKDAREMMREILLTRLEIMAKMEKKDGEFQRQAQVLKDAVLRLLRAK